MAPEAPSDNLILSLFEGSGPLDTPTPGVRAWLAKDLVGEQRAVIVKRLAETRKARATEALSLHHPHIVRTRRWLADSGFLYVIRDVVKGKNLRQTLAALGGARPTPELLRKIITPVLDAIAYAHLQGLPHGGISPDNILVADDGGIWLSDFATTDPTAPQHFSTYQGNATVAGDVKALSRVVSAYLPTAGAFASPAVRGQLEGILSRCDTLEEIRETLNTLERVGASAPKTSPVATVSPPVRTSSPTAPTISQRPGPPLLDIASSVPQKVIVTAPPKANGAPQILVTLAERGIRIPQGGGGFATLIVRNDGTAPLVIRMIATQYAWMNPRDSNLPLTIAPNGAERIGFNISAARLTPGEYRGEVYILANANGPEAEDQKSGWYKHTAPIVVTVEPPLGPTIARAQRGF